jgi:hypothetical protein
MESSKRRLLAALALGAVLTVAGCGASAPGGAGASSGSISATASATVVALSPGSTPVPTQPAARDGTASISGTALAAPSPLRPKLTLTNADAGSTVHIQVGDTIDLALKASTGFQDWQVSGPDAAVLKPVVNPAAAAARGMTLRAFQAAGVGQADITATSRPNCVAGQACPQLVQGFKVTVVVGG